MRSSDGFTVEYESDRPWARVWHPQGFSDPGCEAFLTFWAWQDAPVRRLRRDANELAAAWNGPRTRDLEWTTATWADWHKWVATLTGAERTPRQVARHVDTLYRYYAFWHGYDPRRVPRQFWPSDPRERHRWLQQFWDAQIEAEAAVP
jgi:hypothetical protein